MPPVLPNEQELNLKKRARRRLVGAIVMVILMLIILPKILQDRAALVPQAAIKISMPELGLNQKASATAESASVAPDNLDTGSAPIEASAPIDTESAVTADVDTSSASYQAELEADKQKASAEKAKAAKVAETKSTANQAGGFAIQVGVYSDAANVKKLQQKLTQAGFASHTEKIASNNGDKIRLRVGQFSSRQEAIATLTKLQQVDLPGMVISNE